MTWRHLDLENAVSRKSEAGTPSPISWTKRRRPGPAPGPKKVESYANVFTTVFADKKVLIS